MQASALRKLCVESNEYFRANLTEERYIWNENLRELKAQMKSEVAHVEPEAIVETVTSLKDTAAIVDEPEKEKLTEKPEMFSSPSETFCQIDQPDFEVFFEEADELLSESIMLIDSNDKKFRSKEASVPSEQDEDSHSTKGETSRLSEGSSDFDIDDFLNITKEQIMEMTNDISNILSDKDDAIDDRIKSPRKTSRKRKAETYPCGVKIDLKTSKVTNLGPVPVSRSVSKKTTSVKPQATLKTKVVQPTKPGLLIKCEICKCCFADKKLLALHKKENHKVVQRNKRDNVAVRPARS